MQLGLPVAVTASMLARRALDGWMEEVVDEEAAAAARLAATELVTNAVQHSGLQLGDEVILRALAMPQLVRIEVEQPSSAAGARIVDRDDRRGPHGGGYGLRIVDEDRREMGCRARAARLRLVRDRRPLSVRYLMDEPVPPH
jgi:anti-sigma regulatory factor (Ser/Thr protein kinase)